MKRFILFIITSFCLPYFISAQKFSHWGALKPGNYGVGYRSMYKHDNSRTFIPERNYEGNIFPGVRSRPLHIQFFYPAQISDNAARISYENYLNLRTDSSLTALINKELQQRAKQIHDYYQNKYLQNYKNNLYDKLMKIRVAATLNAPAAKGHFPLIIYAGGANFGTDENIVLWEYLASHGYIVAVVPTMGTTTVEFSADAIGLETLTRDMEFLLGQAREELPFADLNRVVAMGFSYGGQAALLMAMRNPDIKAVIGLDPSFISKNYSRFLKNSAFYKVENVTIPILELHRKDESQVTYDLTDSFKYSERYSFEISELNHVDFTNFALLYNAVLPDKSKQNSSITGRKTAFEAQASFILNFFDVYLKTGQTKKEDLKKNPLLDLKPPHNVSFLFSPAISAPPSYSDFLQIIREKGVARAEHIYREVLKRDPNAAVLSESSINGIGYELISGGNIDAAIHLLQLNIARFPNSTTAYDLLADAFKRKDNLSCVVYSYRKLLEVLPRDATLEEPVKASLQNNVTKKLNQLKDSSEARNCLIKNN